MGGNSSEFLELGDETCAVTEQVKKDLALGHE